MSTSVRYLLLAALSLLALPVAPLTADAQSREPSTLLLGGGGAADHGGQLVPSYHLGARRLLLSGDSLHLVDVDGRPYRVARLSLLAEGQYQRSSGATRCEVVEQEGCWRREHLLSAGLTTVWAVTPERHAMQLYFVPGGVSLHLSSRRMLERGEPSEAAPFGIYTPGEMDHRVGVGISNGIGLRLRMAGHSGLLELKPTLIRFDDGKRGGSIQLTAGLAL
jgi:hypothetical protein